MFETVQQVLDDAAVTQAERGLIAACRRGVGHVAGDGNLPPAGQMGDDVTIRANVIRLLALGGGAACGLHVAGVTLTGAVITGQLDLRFAKCRGTLRLRKCRLTVAPQMEQVELAEISLIGSSFPGLFAQGAKVAGGVFLIDAKTTGTTDFGSAQIGGQLVCNGATLNGGRAKALNAQGANVTGGVFLTGVQATGMVAVNNAQIGGQLVCNDARLNGSGGKALYAQGAKVTASVFLTGATATGTVDVNGAQIGGQLVCKGATLNSGGAKALNAQGAKVTESLILTDVNAKGTVDVNSAQIGGQITCSGATLNGGTGDALNAQSLRVEGAFLFRHVAAVIGRVNLDGAYVRDLADDAASWDKCGALSLDGFTYDRISGGTSPRSFASRKVWLKLGSQFDGEFFPQPYTQFAKVMRAAGHMAEARKALMGGQQAAALHLREQARIAQRFFRAMRRVSHQPIAAQVNVADVARSHANGALQAKVDHILDHFNRTHLPLPTPSNAPTPPDAFTMHMAQRDFRNQMFAGATSARLSIGLNTLKDWISRHVIGYGFAPHRAIWAMAALVIPAAIGFSYAYHHGAMVPNSDVILTSVSWLWALVQDGQAPTVIWDDGATARHYETFYALAYAFDVFVPLVDLGQQSAWTATTVSWLGWGARIGTMGLEVMGWIITALAAASVTGLVQRKDPD
jgi:hypothetical protein